ncbi:Glycosyltransferase family 28, N-terminal domain [Dillenia turbinata]|uniref:Glycosyltransferase family 28, N-terminal domain n=1 Tax=Dillenia turbinata TaxID=194707 RepID=A0AAN8YQB8_9MAGN
MPSPSSKGNRQLIIFQFRFRFTLSGQNFTNSLHKKGYLSIPDYFHDCDYDSDRSSSDTSVEDFVDCEIPIDDENGDGEIGVDSSIINAGPSSSSGLVERDPLTPSPEPHEVSKSGRSELTLVQVAKLARQIKALRLLAANIHDDKVPFKKKINESLDTEEACFYTVGILRSSVHNFAWLQELCLVIVKEDLSSLHGFMHLLMVTLDLIGLQLELPFLRWLRRVATVKDDGTVQFEVPANIKPDTVGGAPGVAEDGISDIGELDTIGIQGIHPLQIVMLIVGTRGDVQPFVAIGKRLQEHGHRVRLATHANFREFVLTAGLEFFPLGGDPKVLAGCKSPLILFSSAIISCSA